MKKISKINEQIFSLLERANEINSFEARNDFDTREGYIVGNIKVYEWLIASDVEEHIKTLNLTEEEKESLLIEFNEDRLNSIYYHTCENQVSYFKDFVDLCATTNFNKLWRAFNTIKENFCSIELKYYYNYIEGHEDKTLKEFQKYFISKNEKDFQEYCILSQFDEKNVWQFGRSGGWLSFAECSEVENFCEDEANMYYYLQSAYNEDNNKEFNEILNDNIYRNETKKELIKRIEDAIKCFDEKIEAVNWMLKHIEDELKGFKENLLHQLEYEIDNFIDQEFNIDIQIRNFLNGNTNALNFIKEVENDKIVTNFGAKVLIKDAIKFINAIKNKVNVIGQKIGPYTINKVLIEQSKTFVKIGCHVFNVESTETRLNELKLI
jgi:hypothetical protein